MPDEPTEHVRWRHLDTPTKVLGLTLGLIVVTIVLLHRGSDVLAAIVAALILSTGEVDGG